VGSVIELESTSRDEPATLEPSDVADLGAALGLSLAAVK
jgi:hypothetical protein